MTHQRAVQLHMQKMRSCTAAILMLSRTDSSWPMLWSFSQQLVDSPKYIVTVYPLNNECYEQGTLLPMFLTHLCMLSNRYATVMQQVCNRIVQSAT